MSEECSLSASKASIPPSKRCSLASEIHSGRVDPEVPVAGRFFCQSPAADAADIDVHELLLRVVADAPTMQTQSSISQGGGFHTGHADINSHGLHVQAVLRDSAGAAAEKVVTPGRAISANHIDFGILPAEAAGQVVQQVKEPRVEVMDSAGAMVAEEELKLLDGRRNILVTPAIDHINPLVGVSVIEPNTVARDLRWRIEAVS